MAKLDESVAAVVVAHTRGAEATKRQAGVEHVLHAGVDTYTTRLRVFDNVVNVCLSGRVDVEAKRFTANVVRFLDCFLDGVKANHRQDRAKDLLMQDLVVHLGVIHKGGGHELVRGINGASRRKDDISGGGVHQVLDALDMSLGHNTSKVGVLGSITAVSAAGELYKLLEKFVLDRVVHKHVVSSDADLAYVELLGPEDALSSNVEVGRGVHKGRALASELERDWGEVLGSSLHNDLAYHLATSVQDVVKLECQEASGLGNLAFDNAKARGIEVLVDQLEQNCRGVGRELTGLDDNTVTSGNVVQERGHSEVKGEVEGRNDQSDSLRLVTNH
mmetsp:Transcript_4725/g.8380  ORF Transcript_4725/g.8380 Transcript_4725/m.8380 type:complete len:332 (+) Transcript_4725:305-1300(+)